MITDQSEYFGGTVWQHENTLEILKCAEQIDALIVRLMRAAGVQMIE